MTIITDPDDPRFHLRPLRLRDRGAWFELRRGNTHWLEPWEATNPQGSGYPLSYRGYVRMARQSARRDQGHWLVLVHGEELIGHLTLTGIQRGSLQSGVIGYWIDAGWAGQGLMPRAVAMATDWAMFDLGLHRIEINIRPENHASLRVVEKLGFRDEGLRLRYLHIRGAWCDHRTFALTREDIGQGLLERLRRVRGSFYNGDTDTFGD